MAARWTRIWWVPAGLQPAGEPGQLPAGARSRSTTSYSVRAGLPSATTAIFSGSQGIAADRGVDDPVRRLGVAPHEGVVASPRGAGGELRDQRGARPPVGGPRRAARSCRRRGGGRCPGGRAADPGDVGKSGEQAVDQRARRGCRRRGGRRGPPACRRRPRRRRRGRRRTRRRIGRAARRRGIADGSTSTTAAPAEADLARRRRPRRRRAPPAAISAATADRLTSASRATTRSSRSPARAGRDALADHGPGLGSSRRPVRRDRGVGRSPRAGAPCSRSAGAADRDRRCRRR